MTEELVSGPLLPDEQLVVDSFKMFIRESEFKQGMPVHVAKCKLADGRVYEILFAKSHPRIVKSAKKLSPQSESSKAWSDENHRRGVDGAAGRFSDAPEPDGSAD